MATNAERPDDDDRFRLDFTTVVILAIGVALFALLTFSLWTGHDPGH